MSNGYPDGCTQATLDRWQGIGDRGYSPDPDAGTYEPEQWRRGERAARINARADLLADEAWSEIAAPEPEPTRDQWGIRHYPADPVGSYLVDQTLGIALVRAMVRAAATTDIAERDALRALAADLASSLAADCAKARAHELAEAREYADAAAAEDARLAGLCADAMERNGATR